MFDDDQQRRVRHNDQRLRTIAAANDLLERVPIAMANMWPILQELITYYETDWMRDHAELDGTPEGQVGVLSEDGVWNEMHRFYQTMTEIRDEATRIVREYEPSDE